MLFFFVLQQNLLNEFAKAELLDAEVECPNCKQKREHWKTVFLKKPPPVLSITLMRFSYSMENAVLEKIESRFVQRN